jgi:hypothetical protein
MTLEQLQRIFPDATSDTWHQHPNGGGWVQNTAKVAETAYIGEYAIVVENAMEFENAKIKAIKEGRLNLTEPGKAPERWYSAMVFESPSKSGGELK